MARLPLWRRLGWRLAASVLLLTALGILVSGFLQYRAQERWLRASLAMTHARPYRGARSIEAALDELGREAGHQFDPQIVEAALAISVERWVAVLGLERPETELTHA
jgi:hypothetical protein